MTATEKGEDALTTLAEMAQATGIARRAMETRAKRAGWPFSEVRARGGLKRLYALAGLPEDLRAAVIFHRAQCSGSVATVPDAAPLGNRPADETPAEGATFQYDRTALWARFESLAESRKAAAKRKHELVEMALTLARAGEKQRRAFELVGAKTGTPWRTIEHWYQGTKGRPGCKQYHRVDWLAALADNHRGRDDYAPCDDDAWEWFKAAYLRPEKPGLQQVYRQLQRLGAERGWTIPDDHTLRRRLERQVPKSVRVLRREGEEALMRLYPHLERSVRGLHAVQWINGDGYQHNVFVRWPDGSIERPRTWFWQDVMSRKILAWRVDQTENADLIRAAFADVLTFGIPEHVTLDNTRAAANKWMSGGVRHRYRFKVKEDDPLGIFPMLGCQVHWTSVFNGRGHGQAKPIERAFGVGGMGEVVDKHPNFAGAYTGANVNAKPENYGSAAVPLELFIRVLASEVAAWNARPGRRTELGEGRYSFDEIFERSYQIAPITKATDEQRRLCLLCAEAVRVQRDTTFTLEAGAVVGAGRGGRNRYGSPLLDDYVGQRIVVRFDPQELHSHVFLYTLQGGYIGRGDCIEAVAFGDTDAARELSRARNQMIRATKQAAKAEIRMSALEAGGLLPEVAAAVPPEATVVRLMKPAAPVPREPVPLTEEQKAIHQALIEEMNAPAPVTRIETDPRRIYVRYLALSEALAAGQALSESDQAFYTYYHDSTECDAMRSLAESFPVEFQQLANDRGGHS